MSDLPPTLHRITAAPQDAGLRLDRFLALRLDGISRARLKVLIEAGRVAGDGQTITEPSHRVKPGQNYHLSVPVAVEAEPRGQEIPLAVAYEDAHLIVVDKPAGMVVHPAAGNPDNTLVNALINHCGASLSGIGGVRRPGIVHRLDKDTSGLMVAAKTDAAHAGLAQAFASRDIERVYTALAWGSPRPPAGEIIGAIGRDPRNRQRMAVVAGGGKAALTRYRVLRHLADGAVSLLECRLATGRTHQIRVHLSHAGHPLLGDPVYGGRPRGRGRARHLPQAAAMAVADFSRQALHAGVLGFVHPVTGVTLRFESPPPADLNRLIAALDGG